MVVAQDRFERNPAARSRPRLGRRLVYGLAAAGVLLLVGLALFFLKPGKPPAMPAKPTPSLTVTAASPRNALWAGVLEASGVVAPWQEAIIGAQIGGYQLSDVRVNVGDQVKKGQVLAQFDPDLLRADEAQLEANYEMAAANEKRALALQKVDAIAAQTAEQATTTARMTLAQLQSKRLQLRYADVVAPDDGVISARTATLGAVVPVGQEMFRLIRQNRLEWRGELTAAQIVHIAIGQRIALSLPDGSGGAATVRQIAPALDNQSRLGIVYADIIPGSHARAGMYADGRVALTQTPALVIPAEAVVLRDGRTYVLKLADASATPRLRQQLVATGRRQGDEIEIVTGLTSSDRIVAAGAGFLSDNDVVRLAQSPR
jgi:RND family efflux transporter MFP subunit